MAILHPPVPPGVAGGRGSAPRPACPDQVVLDSVRNRIRCVWACALVGILGALALPGPAPAQTDSGLQIRYIVVGSDETLTYPNDPSDPDRLTTLPDEHTSFLPLGAKEKTYLVFSSSKQASEGIGGALVLKTSDLQTFEYATDLGYDVHVMAPPVAIGSCNPKYATEFDENYAAPGSVVRDPTLPAGNLIMIYEAENHCPGGTYQHPLYATVGFARSSDNGKTWPPPANGPLGNADRHPILKCPNPQPSTNYDIPLGDAIPSAFVDHDPSGDCYLYVLWGYSDGGLEPSSDGLVHMARAKLGADPLDFRKWYQGAFTEPGIGGLESGVLPSHGCGANAHQGMAGLSYNDDLGLYLLTFMCIAGPSGSTVGSWYYSTATSLGLQDWTTPELIVNSEFPIVSPCPGLTQGGEFDGYYPSFMSPGAAAGHTRLTGKVFFLSGCDNGPRTFASRTFEIVTNQVRRHLKREP